MRREHELIADRLSTALPVSAGRTLRLSGPSAAVSFVAGQRGKGGEHVHDGR